MADPTQQLHELATLYGIQLFYWDVGGKQVWATPDGLLRAVRALGSPIERIDQTADALRRRQRELWERQLEPVAVCWDGYPAEMLFRCPAADLARPHQCRLVLENGQTYRWTVRPAELPDAGSVEIDGMRYAARRLHLIGPYPFGYHQLTVECGKRVCECTLIAAPVRAPEPKASATGRGNPSLTLPARSGKTWGLFVPLYALSSAAAGRRRLCRSRNAGIVGAGSGRRHGRHAADAGRLPR